MFVLLVINFRTSLYSTMIRDLNYLKTVTLILEHSVNLVTTLSQNFTILQVQCIEIRTGRDFSPSLYFTSK
jgi:hypothetical protein